MMSMRVNMTHNHAIQPLHLGLYEDFAVCWRRVLKTSCALIFPVANRGSTLQGTIISREQITYMIISLEDLLRVVLREESTWDSWG